MIKKYPTEADLTLFIDSMKGVKPLKHNKISPTKSPPPTRNEIVKKISERSVETEYFNLPDRDWIDAVGTEEILSYKRNGIADKILRKLAKGQYNVDAKLDLHSYSKEKARLATDRFLQHCLNRQYKMVLLIHGKGRFTTTPILKSYINYWLPTIKEVLAFCSALPKHGGTGAVYILLSTKKHIVSNE